MRKVEVELGKTYLAKVSGKLAEVRLDAESPYGGWIATNMKTHRRVRIRTAARLRRVVTVEVPAAPMQNCCPFHAAGARDLACGGDAPNESGKHRRDCAYHGGGDCTCGYAPGGDA